MGQYYRVEIFFVPQAGVKINAEEEILAMEKSMKSLPSPLQPGFHFCC